MQRHGSVANAQLLVGGKDGMKAKKDKSHDELTIKAYVEAKSVVLNVALMWEAREKMITLLSATGSVKRVA